MLRKVLVCQPHGYCGNQDFGVLGAIQIAQKTAKKYPGRTYLLGEIVHNQHVVDWLEKSAGVKTVQKLTAIPKGATVIIRAHGVGPKIYQEAKKRGLKIVDATCPLVAQAHREAKKLAAQGKKIIFVCSEKDHDEAVGVAGEAIDSIKLVTLNELNQVKIENPQNTVVLTQTTLSVSETQAKLKKLKKKYPGLLIKPHICLATTKRQQAVINLAKKVSLMIIVGSPTSSNSNRLKEVAQASGSQAYIVDTAEELETHWFKGKQTVGISSGASTPEWLLNEVVAKIKELG